MICHEKRLIFIHIARTGGSSVEHALVGSDWWLVEPETKHLSASQTRALYGQEVWDSYTKFTIVRNPWDRMVSMFARRAWIPSGVDDFRGFLDLVRPHPNEKYDSLYYHEILDEAVDEVLRFETLSEDFAHFVDRLGMPGVTIPHLERTEREPYTSYYTPETMEIVRRRFARDILDYGYEF
jgi:hypothetical protein